MRDDLHWLPVRQRIPFKLSTLVSKCLRRSAPSYLADMCIPVSTASGRSCLRSCSRCDLRNPRYRLSQYRSRSLSVSGPTAWNSLPTAVHSGLYVAQACAHLCHQLRHLLMLVAMVNLVLNLVKRFTGNPAVYGYKVIVFLLLYIYALNSASDQCT